MPDQKERPVPKSMKKIVPNFYLSLILIVIALSYFKIIYFPKIMIGVLAQYIQMLLVRQTTDVHLILLQGSNTKQAPAVFLPLE